jgi:hypothetical protein
MKIINFFKLFFTSIHVIKKNYILFNYYFYLKKKLTYQLEDSNIKFSKSKKKTIIFTLIETSHSVNFFLMLFAKILKIRGYKVLALVCDQYLNACEVKSIRKNKNPCYECKFNQKKIYPFFKIEIINLSDFNNTNLDIKINKIVERFKKNDYSFKKNDEFHYLNTAISDSVIRYYYGGIFDKKYKENIPQISSDHCKTAVYMHEISKIIDLKYKPSSVVSLMSSYSSWYPLFYYFRKKNRFRELRFNTKKLYFDINKFFPSKKLFNNFLKRKNKIKLNTNENTEILKFLKHRFNSQTINTKTFKNLKSEKIKSRQIERTLKINKEKINIFIFPNVFWDVGLSDRGHLFNSVLEWLFYTINLLKNDPRYHIYIRPHPAEFNHSFSLWGVEKIIKKKYGNSISNLSFIEESFKYSSYELKPFIDLALVFNGTLNLEFMLLNVPVISTGITPMKGMSLNKEVKSLHQYKKILVDINYNFSKFLVKDKKRLMMFAYFWFIKRDLNWNKKNYYVHSLNRFKGFNFKSLYQCNLNDTQTNSIVRFILEGKQVF